MSDHSTVIDMQYPSQGTFECNAPDDAPCHAVWKCDCEAIYDYESIGGCPTHRHSPETGSGIHVGTFDNNQCNLRDWFENQDESVSGQVRVHVSVGEHDSDYVLFKVDDAEVVENV